MSKSNWLPDDKQTGNFSNNQQDTFDPKKRYVGIRLQQGVPLLDRDWNELEDIRRYAEVMLGQYYIGNGAPDDGFKVSLIDAAVLNFGISSGRCLVDGFDVVNEPYDQNGDKFDFILYSQQEDVPAITSFSEPRTDTVYLDVWVEEVSAVQDSALKNSRDIDMETCRRHKLEWRVRVDEGSKGYEKVLFHHYYDLAKINWKIVDNVPVSNVEDLRVTGLKVLQLREDVELLKDHAGKHTHSKLVGEGGAPDPALQVDQNGNVGIGTVDPGKKLDVNGDIRANNFYKLLPHNIISNSFMNRLNGNVPIGFTIGSYNAGTSTMQIEAVHPFTKGFEGPYSPSKPANAVDNVDDATGSNPYWFGRYWKGPRAARGGLADGWMGRSDGHILKITGRRDASSRSSNIYVMFPKEQRVLTARLLFRAWVKITKGAIDFGTDMGVNPQITRVMTETAPQGWYFINRIFDSTHVTDIGGHAFIFKCLGEEAVHGGDFEIYLALPYLANIEIDDSPHWSPSILDILSDYGATIDFSTGNVGIGTADPKAALHIKGQAVFDEGNGNVTFYGAVDNLEHNGYLHLLNSTGQQTALGLKAGGVLVSDTYAYANPGKNDLIVKGKVGIGTADPKAALHIKGKAVFDEGDGNVTFYGAADNVEHNGYLHLLNSTGHQTAWGLKAGGVLVSDTYAYANPGKNDLIVKGNVGIGRTSPSEKLSIEGNIDMIGENRRIYMGGAFNTTFGIAFSSSYSDYGIFYTEGSLDFVSISPNGNSKDGVMNVYGNGKVGIGTASPHPNLKLDVRGSDGWIGSGDNSQAIGGWRLGRWPAVVPTQWLYLSRVDQNQFQDLAIGALWACGALRFGSADDLAEMTPADPNENLEPGDVVVIDDSHCVRVTKSKKPYDKAVAGVISDTSTAGLVIGGSHPNDVKRPDIKAVALAGRVLTKVTLENGSIEAGDFLTTSSTPGYAMKTKKQCFTLGKALEPFFGGSNGESCGKIWVLINLSMYTENYTNIHSGIGVDFAEYFESKSGKKIDVGTAVVLEGNNIRPADKDQIPIGIISRNPIIVGNIYAEWPKKHLRDEFGRVIMEEYQKEIMAPKKEKVKKERQKVEKKKVKQEVTRTEIVKIKGKYCQKEITETIEREIEEPVFKEEDLYDAKGKQVIGKHRVPVMETYQEEIDVLDEKGQPIMIGTGKFETKTRAKINPEHDETKEYISREKRPEWNCVGLLGQLPLLKGQPTAPTWIKIKDLTKDVELWLVK